MTKPDALIERAVEKAARVLCRHRGADPDTIFVSGERRAPLWRGCEKEARAAIVAFLRDLHWNQVEIPLHDLADLIERGGG